MSATTEVAAGPWAAPGARLLLRADAPIPVWLDERTRGLGGSDASTVAGVNRWSSRYELWLDKTGRAHPKDETRAMQLGRLFEPILRQMFTEDTGIGVRRAGLMESRQWPLLRVSLDGMTGDGGILEAKVTNWRLAGEWDDDQVSDHAEVQAQHGLAVTGRSHAWVVALIDGRDFRVRRVERDEDLIRDLVELEHAFWDEHVLGDVAPPVDAAALPAVKARWSDVGRPSRSVDRDDWTEIKAAYQSAKAIAKAADLDVDLTEARLRELFADAEVLTVDDRTVATNKQISPRRIDGKRLRAELPDIADQYETTTPYRRLHIPKEK